MLIGKIDINTLASYFGLNVTYRAGTSKWNSIAPPYITDENDLAVNFHEKTAKNMYYYLASCTTGYKISYSPASGYRDSIVLRPVGTCITKDIYIKLTYDHYDKPNDDLALNWSKVIFKKTENIGNNLNLLKSVKKHNKAQLDKAIFLSNLINNLK